jgi:uncharacterized cupin superfamily protein
MTESPPLIVNVEDVAEIDHQEGDHWGGTYRPLTPALAALTGRLGVNLTRVPPQRSACPFHSHRREDEVFYVLAGRGIFRYGETLREIRPGDCISCPAGTGIAHQIANPFDEDLIYLAIGGNDPDEIGVYPDSGKVMVRALRTIGYLTPAPYMDGEPERPKILDLFEARK